MAGQRDTGAEPDAEPRPLTYEAASARYCPPTLSLMTLASLMVRTRVREKAPPGGFRRGLGVRGGGLVVSLP